MILRTYVQFCYYGVIWNLKNIYVFELVKKFFILFSQNIAKAKSEIGMDSVWVTHSLYQIQNLHCPSSPKIMF